MFTKRYTEALLYALLILSLLTHKLYNLPNLSIFVLLLPISFLPQERFGLKSPWNFSLLLLPLVYFLHPQNFFSLSLQAFAEELFFRAYLMSKFSNLQVSLLFTLPHVILYGNLWSWLTFFPSLFYGLVYARTGSLVFVSLLHLVSNALWFKVVFPFLSHSSPISL